MIIILVSIIPVQKFTITWCSLLIELQIKATAGGENYVQLRLLYLKNCNHYVINYYGYSITTTLVKT